MNSWGAAFMARFFHAVVTVLLLVPLSASAADVIQLFLASSRTWPLPDTAAAVLTGAEGCTLSFQGIGGPDRSHLDIVAADGTVACSSRPPEAKPKGYADAPWLRRALRTPVFAAPVRAGRTGVPAAVAALSRPLRAPRPLHQPRRHGSSLQCKCVGTET